MPRLKRPKASRKISAPAQPAAQVIRAQKGPQEAFLSSAADIVVYGGAAGGGKSFGLLVEALRHIGNKDFNAVIFRRTTPQIIRPGGLWDESVKLYAPLGTKTNQNEYKHTFPSGAYLRFGHLQYEGTKEEWQGSQIVYMGFDELTHFSRSQFFYMLSRNRSTSGVRPYIRATCNPDPDSFVAELIAWWIDQKTGFPIPDRSGVIRWFYQLDDHMYWYPSREEGEAAHPELAKIAPPKSFTFIAASIHDNKILLAKDPGYLANLLAQTRVDRERLLGGNWKIRAEAGKVFNRAWFKMVDVAPAGGIECRNFDFAATEKELSKPDPDFTASVKIRKVGGNYYIMDMTAVQEGPTAVERAYVNIAHQDRPLAQRTGSQYRVRFEQEPGSASKRDARRMVSLLDGFDVAAVPVDSDKVTRAKALSSQAEAGNVYIVRGQWNEDWLRNMHGFPDLPHDDIVDATTGAYNDLADDGAERTLMGDVMVTQSPFA